MSFLEIYAIFAIATALVSLYELVWPVIAHRDIEYKKLYLLVFFMLDLLVAPLVFLSCIIPSWGERFRDGLGKELDSVKI